MEDFNHRYLGEPKNRFLSCEKRDDCERFIQWKCQGCYLYNAYLIGFGEGAREAVKRINEMPNPLLLPLMRDDG